MKIFSKTTALLLLLVLPLIASQPKSNKWDYLVSITTEFGVMKAILFDDTPIHKSNFVAQTEKGIYNENIFHRVIDNFMIQGGADTSEQINAKNFKENTLPAELKTGHKHIYGALAAARTNNPEMRSSKSQFYIVENPEGTHFLDGKYTVFGQVVSGLHVINKIAAQKTGAADKPVKDQKFTVSIEKVKRTDLEKFYNLDY